MKRMHQVPVALLLLGALAGGCKSSSTDSGSTAGTPGAADIADVSMLLEENDDSTGAGQVGQPAEMLTFARTELKKAGDVPKSVLRFLSDVRTAAQATAPARSGSTAAGAKFAVWELSHEGTDLRFSVVRINERRVRYALGLRRDKAKAYLPVLTGIFVKGEELRGGRFHLNLTRTNEALGVADGYSGMVHFSFAARGDTAVARRVHYRNVRAGLEPQSTPARNYSVDLLRRFGVGGRARFASIGDVIATQPGQELAAVRILWKTGQGGRADAVIAPLGKVGKAVHASECWGKDGLRSAYLDDVAGNDAENKDEGDVTQCVQLARELPEESKASESGEDADPEVSAELAAAGADIAEADAEAANGEL